MGRQGGDQGGFFGGDGSLAGKKFDVRGPDAADDANLGRGHPGQGCDFARVIHAHLDHAKFVSVIEPNERQRHADVIVEIALGRLGAELGAQHRGDQFLGAGLAAAAGHADRPQGQEAAIGRRKPLQGLECVRHFHKTETRGQIGDERIGDERCHCATILHGTDEGVAIKPVALQGDETIARRQGARVGVQTIDRQRGIALEETASAEAGHFFKRTAAHHAALLSRNSWTTRRSSKG